MEFKSIIKDFHKSSYINGIRKEFNDNNPRLTGAEGADGSSIEDKTYLGFAINFSNHKNSAGSKLADQSLDSYPTSLLFNPEDEYSAYQYLRSTNQIRRAEQIKLFRENLFMLENKFPWYYQKIGGLDELLKIDPTQNYRGKDKQITLSLLESIDLKVSYIFDLYKKSVWDTKYMRWAMPENMRQFSMDIYIAEIRDFHKVDEKTFELKDFDEFLPVLKLTLDKCEFQSIQDGYPFGEISNQNAEAAATQTVNIKIGKIREINTYNLYQLILDDFSTSLGLNEINVSSDTVSVAKTSTKPEQEEKKKGPFKRHLDKVRLRSSIGNVYATEGELFKQIGQLADKLLDRFFLGNIYTDSSFLSGTKSLLSSFALGDLQAASKTISTTATSFITQPIKPATTFLGDIGLSAPPTGGRISQNISFRG